MSARGGRIPLNMSLMRMVLGLPAWMNIVEIQQSAADTALNICHVVVGGPYCPVWKPGAELAELRLFYRTVDCGSAVLDRIDGLDT